MLSSIKGVPEKNPLFLDARKANVPEKYPLFEKSKKGVIFWNAGFLLVFTKKPAFQKITPFFELLEGKNKMTGGGKKDFNPVKSPLLTKREALPL